DGRLELDPVRALGRHLGDALCVGMGVLTGAPITDALAVSRAVKKARPDLTVVWGGWHPSLFPEQCLEDPSVDAVVLGQGEETFAEIVERLARGKSLEGVAGCVHRTGGSPRWEAPRPLGDINAFRRHDYGLVPVERYFHLKRRRQLDYVSSQGCRFRCTFCADPFVYQRGWTGLTPTRVAGELKYWWKRHPFEEVAFQDETFFTSRARVEELAEALLGAGLSVTWTATLRADQGHRMDESTWVRARRSGLKRVMIGMESGSQAMLDWMKKDIKVEQVFECAERCLRYGIGAIFNVIVGFPGEPEESVQASLDAARRLRAMSADFQVAIFYYWPYPGNEIAHQLAREGYGFPSSLGAWADFDYVGSVGPWVDEAKFQLVERFKFYQKHGYGPRPHVVRWPLRAAARWRVERGWYRFPIEKVLVERLRPPQRLS
ncbi:MAG: B12-binding domain-containing radical SAM protein, partial [Acidobacteriota bacterium]